MNVSPCQSASPPPPPPWLVAPESAAASLLGAELLRRAEAPADPPAPTAVADRPPPSRRLPALALLALVVVVAALESGAALGPRVLPAADLQAACAAVRAEFRAGDLIDFAPAWLTQLGQRELGDLMPVTMLGRADSRRYARIWTVTLGQAGAARLNDELAAELTGLTARARREFGHLTLSLYEQAPVAVSYDLTAQLLTAQVAQVAGGEGSRGPEVPCLWSGPVPTAHPARGAAGAFRCPSATVERRVMEVDYRPRYGVVATLAQGQRTILEYSIADADWQGSRLVLWLGLHDYHARKTAVGPAQVVVDLDQGARRVPLTIAVTQGFAKHELELPAGPARSSHVVRLELAAASAQNHFVALHGELRR